MRFASRPVVAAVLVLAMALVGGCTAAVSGSPGVGPIPVRGSASDQLPPSPYPDVSGGPAVTVPSTETTPTSTTPTSTTPTTSAVTSTSSQQGNDQVTLTLDSADGAAVVQRGRPKTVIDVFAEPLCPPCAAFQDSAGAALAGAAQSGRIVLRIHLLTFLDPKSSSGDYSTRAAGTLLCLAAAGDRPEVFARLEERMFSSAFQPKEDSDADHPDAELRAAAVAAGAGASALACIDSGQREKLAQAGDRSAREQLTKAGGVGTPTVLQDGKRLDLSNDDWIKAVTG